MNRYLAGTALALGLLAPLAGDPLEHASPRPAVEVARALDPAGEGRVGAEQVARWIMERKPGLAIYDLRGDSYSEIVNLPQSQHITPEALTARPFDSAATVVLYGDRDTTPVRVWHTLKRRRVNAYYMLDGIGEWTRDILNPVIAPDAGSDERAAFERLAEASRYFGGLPRIAEPDSADTGELLESTVRRGCAF